MIMALFGSRDEEFETVWSLSSQLPFSWYLLPVNAWRTSASHYFGSLKIALAEIDNGENFIWEEFRKIQERVTSQRPFFRQICDWICRTIFPERPLQNSELASALNNPDIIFELKIARDFDGEWFNSAYSFALCLGLSKTMSS
jgi:hypothetical protein